MVLNTNFFYFYPSHPPQSAIANKGGAVGHDPHCSRHHPGGFSLVILHHLGIFNDLKINERGDTLQIQCQCVAHLWYL